MDVTGGKSKGKERPIYLKQSDGILAQILQIVADVTVVTKHGPTIICSSELSKGIRKL